MGVIGEKWRCPTCDMDVGGSMGELRNHVKKVHAVKPAITETRTAAA